MSRSDQAVTAAFAGPQQLLLPLDYPDESVQSAYVDGRNGSSRPDPSCIFCRHADPQVNTVVRSRGTMYARWDNFPASRGHVEIVPFRHILSFFDMTSRETSDMYMLARSVKDTLDSLYRPEGFTIGVNDGSAAGRTVPHLHIHIIPRWHGDVPDPRGGIRRVFADCNPDAWS